MSRKAGVSARWSWIRATVLACSLSLLGVAGAHQAQIDAAQGRRAEAARMLAAAQPGAESGTAQPGAEWGTAQPGAAQPGAPAPAEAPPSSAPAVSAPPASSPPEEPGRLPRFPLPPTRFSWPAAGLAVAVSRMAWTPGETVNPPLDANGFDPVAHWLAGTGEGPDRQPVVLTGHTCYGEGPLCNPGTFPFNRLSFPGWAVGQPASITDAAGQAVPCVLEDRRLVDKSTQFAFPNDPHLVVAFSCNLARPNEQITLVTFRCGP